MLLQFNYSVDKTSVTRLSGTVCPESLRPLEQIDGLSIYQQSQASTLFSVAASGDHVCIVLGRVCRRNTDDSSNLGAADFLSRFVAELTSGELLSLKGNFAAVVFDSRLKQLLLITDHLATVPLYYANTPETALISTLPQHIAASQLVKSGIDEYQLARYCLPCFMPNDKTFFKNVSSVPPASIARLGAGLTKVNSYWSLDGEMLRLAILSPDEFYSRIRTLVASAVSFAVGDCNRVGLLLSGGIDSSVVAYETCEQFRHSGKKNAVVAACATNKDENSKSDRHFASLLSRELGIPLLFEDGLSVPFEAVDTYFDATGQPPIDAFYPMQFQLLQTLANQGVNVVLCGEGGESSVSSYGDGWLCQLLRTGKLITLGTELARAASWSDEKELLLETIRPFTNRLLARVLGLKPCFKSFEELTRNHCLNPDFARGVWCNLKDEIECAINYPNSYFPMPPLSTRQNDLLNLVRINPAHFYSGRIAGITLACPLLDPDLVESVIRSNPAFRRSGMRRRLIATASYQGRLPLKILNRSSKSPFFGGYERWLQRESVKFNDQLSVASTYFGNSDSAAPGGALEIAKLHRMHRTAVASRFLAWANRKLSTAP